MAAQQDEQYLFPDFPISEEVFSPLLVLLGYIPLPTFCSYHAQIPYIPTLRGPPSKREINYAHYERISLFVLDAQVPCGAVCISHERIALKNEVKGVHVRRHFVDNHAFG